MLFLGLILSLIMGGALGLLGGGGSILTLPILVYALGLEPRSAIATSLLVVGVTSLAALVSHARAGHVHWRTGLVFGGVSMVGAFLGGWLARFVPGSWLLALFAILMAVTAVAMLRPRKAVGEEPVVAQPRFALLAVEGLVVGVVTGLVGAGGGFLVVPALALLAGLPMRAAVGTSLLIIAMKSFAGFAGYLSHETVDWTLAAVVGGAAVVGSFGGAWLGRRVPAASLRRGFGGFVLAMAAFMLLREASPAVRHALLVERWPFWAGGLAIGGFVLLFLVGAGRALGVSSGFTDACSAVIDPAARASWRLRFLGGIVLGGGLGALLAGGLVPTSAVPMLDAAGLGLAAKAALFTLGGVLIGFGARLAGGCTSGHSILGTALLARSSLVATAGFMIAGFATTWLLLGGL